MNGNILVGGNRKVSQMFLTLHSQGFKYVIYSTALGIRPELKSEIVKEPGDFSEAESVKEYFNWIKISQDRYWVGLE